MGWGKGSDAMYKEDALDLITRLAKELEEAKATTAAEADRHMDLCAVARQFVLDNSKEPPTDPPDLEYLF